MRDSWFIHTDSLGADRNTAADYFQELCDCYCQSHRKYHNLHHIVQMLTMAAQFSAQIQNQPAVFFATWYHDAVYKVPSKKNETRSAQLAAQRLAELLADDALIEMVTEMIEATRAHQWPNPDSDVALLLDIDMSILAAPRAQYLAYEKAIQAEHRLIPNILFNRGRLDFLRSVAAQPNIFLTQAVRAQFEDTARKNVIDEIKRREP